MTEHERQYKARYRREHAAEIKTYCQLVTLSANRDSRFNAYLPLEERLWSRVAINDKTGCWEWTGHRSTVHGAKWHGTIATERSNNERVHRVVYEWLVGSIPLGMFVCHHCDNPVCVNPAHLFVGTQRDNMRDMVVKGRSNKLFGIDCPWSKLTPERIDRARKLHDSGMTMAEIGTVYGVHKGTIQKALSGETWRTDRVGH